MHFWNYQELVQMGSVLPSPTIGNTEWYHLWGSPGCSSSNMAAVSAPPPSIKHPGYKPSTSLLLRMQKSSHTEKVLLKAHYLSSKVRHSHKWQKTRDKVTSSTQPPQRHFNCMTTYDCFFPSLFLIQWVRWKGKIKAVQATWILTFREAVNFSDQEALHT